MKKILSLISVLLLLVSMSFPVFALNPPVTVVNVPEKAAVIDGKAEPGEWDGATELILNPIDPRSWENGFLGNILPPASHTNEDFNNTIRLMIKDGYLYYFEERIDKTPFYGSNDIRKSYCQDGTLIWFINTDGTRHSISVFATNKGSEPFMMFNKNDDQPAGTRLNCEIVSDIRDNGFIIEAKIKLTSLLLKEDYFTQGKMMTTYCCVNIYNSSFSGNSEDLWGNYGYEAWYVGVNNWMSSPRIKVTNAAESVSSVSGDNSSSVSSSAGIGTSSQINGNTSSGGTSVSSLNSVSSGSGNNSVSPESGSGSSLSAIASNSNNASQLSSGEQQEQLASDSSDIQAVSGDSVKKSSGTWIYFVIAAAVLLSAAAAFYFLKYKKDKKAE